MRFVGVTFLYAPEVRALIGAGTARAAARLAATRVDELLVPVRQPVM